MVDYQASRFFRITQANRIFPVFVYHYFVHKITISSLVYVHGRFRIFALSVRVLSQYRSGCTGTINLRGNFRALNTVRAEFQRSLC